VPGADVLNWTLMVLGYAAAFRGDHTRSEQLFETAVDVTVPPRTHGRVEDQLTTPTSRSIG